MEFEITTQVLLIGGVLGLIMGAVANKTNFCTMGGVSDWVNMGDTSRLRSWFLAIGLGILGVALLEGVGMVDMGTTRPPYRMSMFLWPRYILGGLIFGIGMTLGSGCANKNLVRMGGGNIKSILVLIVIGIMAYLMTKTNLYANLFHGWIAPISPDLASFGIEGQSFGVVIGSLLDLDNPASLELYVALLAAALILFVVLRSSEFRHHWELLFGGAVIGLVIVAAWYVTAGSMGTEWVEFAEFMDEPPPGVGAQSFTFVNPTGEALVYLSTTPTQVGLITFGMATLFGVIAGSFLYALLSRTFRIEWFASLQDFSNHMIGAVLMGIGGALSMGCTVGQGISGVSTMAIGSFVTLGAIILGSALTMKVQYYKLVYEEEATILSALITGLVDLKLLPQGMRKHEAV